MNRRVIFPIERRGKYATLQRITQFYVTGTHFLINGATSIFLCGLIWVIQLVHYPSFHFVEDSRFIDFQAFHTQRI